MSDKKNSGGGGALVGAFVGTMLGGPLGAIIGGLIGGAATQSRRQSSGVRSRAGEVDDDGWVRNDDGTWRPRGPPCAT